jgi:hypothetical protein
VIFCIKSSHRPNFLRLHLNTAEIIALTSVPSLSTRRIPARAQFNTLNYRAQAKRQISSRHSAAENFSFSRAHH